jgi:hypothetical protein
VRWRRREKKRLHSGRGAREQSGEKEPKGGDIGGGDGGVV